MDIVNDEHVTQFYQIAFPRVNDRSNVVVSQEADLSIAPTLQQRQRHLHLRKVIAHGDVVLQNSKHTTIGAANHCKRFDVRTCHIEDKCWILQSFEVEFARSEIDHTSFLGKQSHRRTVAIG